MRFLARCLGNLLFIAVLAAMLVGFVALITYKPAEFCGLCAGVFTLAGILILSDMLVEWGSKPKRDPTYPLPSDEWWDEND